MKQLALFITTLTTAICLAAPQSAAEFPLEKMKSEVRFLALAKPGSLKIQGELKQPEAGKRSLDGKLKLDGTKLAGNATVRLDDFDTGLSLRNRHLRERLETTKYPETVLTLEPTILPDSFKTSEASADKVEFKGTLKLHGKETKVVGQLSCTKKKNKHSFDFSFPVKLTSVGIEPPSYLGVSVADEVKISVSVATP